MSTAKIYDGQQCPKCQEPAMPKWKDGATARCCQVCGYIEERPKLTVATKV